MQGNPNLNYYALLGVNSSASVQQIRSAYRELSKLYHPDTTELPPAIATAKFQQINEAYATLSSPERKVAYDLKMGYSRVSVIQAPPNLDRPTSESRKFRSSADLDASDRPLSPGELFALFILGVTFVACLLLVITIGLTRGEFALQPLTASGTVKNSAPAPQMLPSSTSELEALPIQLPIKPPPSEPAPSELEVPSIQLPLQPPVESSPELHPPLNPPDLSLPSLGDF